MLRLVTLMLHVPTLLGASPVNVTKDTLEMEPLVKVCKYLCSINSLMMIADYISTRFCYSMVDRLIKVDLNALW